MLLSVFSIFAPLQPFFYMVACARTLYIGKTSKTLLFAVYRLFLA
nr:MAG TPA: hypothetical protein [Caudoviricetes sp.]